MQHKRAREPFHILTSLPLTVSRKPHAPAAFCNSVDFSSAATTDTSGAAAAETNRTLSASAITTRGGEPPNPGHTCSPESLLALPFLDASSPRRSTVEHGHSRLCPPAPHGVRQLRISWSPDRANRDLGSNDIYVMRIAEDQNGSTSRGTCYYEGTVFFSTAFDDIFTLPNRQASGVRMSRQRAF